MTRLEQDGHELKTLIRNAEALGDEYMAALAALRMKMLAARSHPDVVPHEGQAALSRLGHAERQAFASSTDLFRVHNALSELAIRMGVEHPTDPLATSGELESADGAPQPTH
jgi:hypothetical protein